MKNTMKTTGITYMPQIPSDWNKESIRHVTSFVYRGIAPNYIEDETKPMVVNQATFSQGFWNISKVRHTNTHSNGCRGKVFPGDILLASTGGGVLGKTYYYAEEGNYIADSHVTIIRCNERLHSRYLFYFLSNSYALINDLLAKGSTNQTELQRDLLLKLEIPLPVKKEQVKIVKFLDEKIPQINKVVNVLEKEIELLEATKKSIVTEIMIHGINENVDTKDSGINYIGNIPSHWDVKKLRFLGKLQNGITKSGDDFGRGFPFVSYGNVYNNYALPEYVEGLVDSSPSERMIYSVKKGDVFFTRTSETIEEIGFASTCLKNIKNAVYAGFVIRFRPEENILCPGFSKYYFRSDIHREFFVKEMNIITRASLGQDLLKNLPVLIPPYDEQKEIVKYLDKKCGALDSIIKAKKRQIEILETHKKSLIYDYITGAKRVEE